ncbi:MAG: GTP cyclohydrolase I FolE [Dehalococcoidia bacterium]|nr:GTP cyclohydrolase I FolE [Dehalococcoidia bacterium]
MTNTITDNLQFENGNRMNGLSKEQRVQQLVPLLRKVLELLGEDPERKGLQRTPERWAEALLTYTQGTAASPEDHLRVIFEMDDDDYPVGSDDMIIVDNIHFTSTCEHHMAPFRGTAHVAYIPNPQSRIVTGLSKISRVVTLFARRLQIQERMTQQVARAIDDHLEPLGVIAVVQAAHFCMIQRGVEQRESTTITTARRGVFLTKPQLETRFLEYLRMQDGKPDVL